MKFFVDTADVAAISELNDLGMVDGVTTNPSIILKSGRDILEVTKEICSIVSGPVSAEVVAMKADDMIAEGRKLAAIAPNIAVKVPLTWDGLKACKVLSGDGFMVNVTLCFSANQALLAAKAASQCRGCWFMVSSENWMLSLSVRVRPGRCSYTSPTVKSSK